MTGNANSSRPRRHRGDFLSPATRSAVMSRIRGKGTGPEKTLAAALAELGLAWEEHARDLPGRPDFVFREAMVAVFVDGDFWHGWKFNEWRDKLSEKWEAKIAETRRRDSRNQRALKKMGWRVLRIWEHQLQKSPARCAKRVYRLLEKASLSDKNGKAPRP
ncbi:putative DNA mismatch endonuclease Vsr [Megalodesulfovibrio gigas DSM 1382 = ATCC 19364]|uniref:Putative DNA mismatch endonuclease Vsr n=1 Tax=Megalodesulfovibrio gigas (strain ATCC 19364 / DSM 1382 / NCIMB 9332 / VKM B-1759) TaxID=1121448 RepID=T2G8Z2_MEGG1|nr:very short patch repair endonuclease [Megalodesulfovibrio gigas]AGW12387.1 putative DNA mismatch endonuclease Vsr [Megalodesulfovibrio gigas DSM 1382 = ATCC 19364]